MKKLFLFLMTIQLLLAVDIKEIYVGDIINDDIQSMQKKYFKVKVAPGKQITVKVTHLTGDVDLYLKTETRNRRLPGFRSYNCRSVKRGKKSESCTYLIKGYRGDQSEQTVNILLYGFHFSNYVLEVKEKNEPYACKQRYDPVCARVDVNHFGALYRPKYETFSNMCMMEHNPNATFIHKGKCKTDKPPHRPKPCNRVYRPVCASVKINCITTPCRPVKQTFANLCLMKNNPNATLIHKGKCKTEKPTNRPRICTFIYKPVCASLKVNCITTPCKPVEKTFSNLCMMENNQNATLLHKGRCN